MEKAMLRSELVTKLAEENPHLFQRDVENVLDVIVDTIGDTLAEGGRVEIRGFGVFGVSEREARTGRNPRTGAQVQVAASRKVNFKAGREMHRRLNKQ